MAVNPGNGSNTGPLGIPPGGPWFVNGTTGTIQRQSNPLLAEALATAGWVGFPTQALAKAFASNDLSAHAKAPVRAAVSTAEGVNSFLGRLGNPNLWVRVAEVVVGVVLIAIGLNAMLKGKPMSIVTGAAGTVGKAAILA